MVKKIRRLILIKKLLRGNKFGKLARLGQLNALEEDYKSLASLGTLSAFGGFTDKLKRDLLLLLTKDISLYAMLCRLKTTHPATTYAAADHVSARTLLTYSKPPVTFGRDPNFFISDTVAPRISPSQILRKSALLKVLKPRKGTTRSPAVKSGNVILTRSGETNILPRIKHLHHYRQALALQESESAMQYGRDDQLEQL